MAGRCCAQSLRQSCHPLEKLAETFEKASEGDAAGALQSGLGAAGSATGIAGELLGEDEDEAREALSTASQVAGAAGAVVGAGRSIAGAANHGDGGHAGQAPGSTADAARHLVPDSEAQGVLHGAGQAARGISDAAGGLGSPARQHVEIHIEVSDTSERWGVRHVSLSEGLNTVPRCTVEALYSGHVEAQELLHKEVRLSVERPSQQRNFKGIVWQASVKELTEGVSVQLHVVPAMAYLAERVDSHIYQDKTVVDVIKEVYAEMLGDLSRTVVDEDLQRSYETREYIVQYQESHLDFLSRLAEEEGIFWYFDYQDEREVLVLADTVANCPQARADDDGQAPYHHDPDQLPDDEAVIQAGHQQSVGATDAVVLDYDWSNPSLEVVGKQIGRSEQAPALEVFDHTEALVFHDFSSQYGGNTATVQAGLRAERLDLSRQSWELGSTVVTAIPGHTLEVLGCPNDALDQRYLIVHASSQGSVTEGVSGTWSNSLTVVPTSLPYRPARRTPRPVIPGPELATVVGPSGEEIHTDEHGRVRVHFAWDRYHDKTAENSSCWMRVSHNWAGPGFGTFFLPRIGMEVVVNFLGGNPDRPLVTACVYNGPQRVGVDLPAKKTQSLIRTKSSPNSEGFNEMRFEDEAGNEFIYVHAEKDYNEVVENNHSTHVKNCQTNTVDVDQTETVGNDQTMTVHNDRTKTIDNDEWVEVGHYRSEIVHGNEDIVIEGQRARTVKDDDLLTVQDGNRHVDVQTGKGTEHYAGGREVEVETYDSLRVAGSANRNVEVGGQFNIVVKGAHYALEQGETEKFVQGSRKTYVESASEVHVKCGPTHLLMKKDGSIVLSASSKIAFECGGSKLELTPSGIAMEGTEVQAKAGESLLKLEASKAQLKGAMVDMLADMFATIKGTLVRIN